MAILNTRAGLIGYQTAVLLAARGFLGFPHQRTQPFDVSRARAELGSVVALAAMPGRRIDTSLRWRKSRGMAGDTIDGH